MVLVFQQGHARRNVEHPLDEGQDAQHHEPAAEPRQRRVRGLHERVACGIHLQHAHDDRRAAQREGTGAADLDQLAAAAHLHQQGAARHEAGEGDQEETNALPQR